MAWTRASLALLAICLPVSANALPTYKLPPESSYPKSTSLVQRVYDDAMNESTTMAGAPNRVKAAPTAAERTATNMLDFASDLGGGPQKGFEVKNSDLPRRPSVTLMNSTKDPVIQSASDPIILSPSAPISPSSPSAPQIIGEGFSQPTYEAPQIRASEPVIRTTPSPTNDGSASGIGSFFSAPQIFSATKIFKDNASFHSVDQSETLTTPVIRAHQD